jgi:hypothetical protein
VQEKFSKERAQEAIATTKKGTKSEAIVQIEDIR